MTSQQSLIQSINTLNEYVSSFDELNFFEKDATFIIEQFHRPLNVMITGEFNTGKSTIINTLLQTDYLKTDDVPTTAAVIKMVYGNTLNITLHYNDNRTEEISLDRLTQISAEVDSEGKEIRESLHYIQIELPSERLKTMNILDTPGKNSNYESHTKVTDRFLDEADIAFWVFDVGQVAGSAEVQTLLELGKYVTPFGIINRIDELDPEEDDIEQIVEVNEQRLGDLIQGLIPISALEANEALRTEDEQLLELSNWNAFIHVLEEQLNGEASEQKKIERALRELEKSFITMNKTIEHANNRYNETINIVQNTAKYKDVLQQEMASLQQIYREWEEAKTNKPLNVFQTVTWPTEIQGFLEIEHLLEQQYYMFDDIFKMYDELDDENESLVEEEMELERVKIKLKQEWEDYYDSGLFGGEPILFRGKKKILENETYVLDQNIDDYNRRLHLYEQKVQNLNRNFDERIVELQSIIQSVLVVIEEEIKRKKEMYVDKEIIEKAKVQLKETEWIIPFIHGLKINILPLFEENVNKIIDEFPNATGIHEKCNSCLHLLSTIVEYEKPFEFNKHNEKLIEQLEQSVNKFKKKNVTLTANRTSRRNRAGISKNGKRWITAGTAAAIIFIGSWIGIENKQVIHNQIQQFISKTSAAEADESIMEPPVKEQYIVVTVEAANVRAAGNLEGEILDVMYEGDILTVINKSDEVENFWYEVELEDGQTGWISSTIVELLPNDE